MNRIPPSSSGLGVGHPAARSNFSAASPSRPRATLIKNSRPVLKSPPARIFRTHRCGSSKKCWGIALFVLLPLTCGFAQVAPLQLAPAGSAPSYGETVHLPPWHIVSPRDHTPEQPPFDTFAQILGATTSVQNGTWNARSLTTLADSLRGAPGVVLQESFGGFEPPRISIRGSGINSAPSARGVALLIDGLPFAQADGTFHSGLFDPALFGRVDVYRGTAHYAITPAVLGGVLNTVPPSADTWASANSLTLSAGDFGLHSGRATYGMVQDDTAVRVAASAARQDGWRERSTQDRQLAHAIVHQQLSDTTIGEFSLYAGATDYDVPGPLNWNAARTDPRSNFVAVIRDQPHRESTVVRAAARFETTLVDSSFSGGLSWQQLADDFRQLRPRGETDSTSRDWGGHLTYTRQLASGDIEHHLVTRAVAALGTDNVTRFTNVNGTRGDRFARYDNQGRTLSFSAEDLAWLRPDFAVGAGFSVVHAQRDVTDHLHPPGDPMSVTIDQSYTTWSPRAGLHWRIHPETTLYATVSHGSEPPTFSDLLAVGGAYPNLRVVNRPLDTQTATTLELGGHGDIGALNWTVTLYHGWWRDEILRLADANGAPLGGINAPRTTHQGIEAGLSWALLDTEAHQLHLTATGTWNHFTFDDDPVFGRKRLAGVPPHVGNADLTYSFRQLGSASIGATWLGGDTSADHAGQLTYPSYALLHARIAWTPLENLTLFAEGKNLTDRWHIASTAGVLDIARNPAATTIFLPGVTRSFAAGLEWRF